MSGLREAGDRLFAAAMDYVAHVDPAALHTVDPRAAPSGAVTLTPNPNPEIGTPESDLEDALTGWLRALASADGDSPGGPTCPICGKADEHAHLAPAPEEE